MTAPDPLADVPTQEILDEVVKRLRGERVDAWQDIVAGWDEWVRCEFRNKTTGHQCRRPAVWVGHRHEHGPRVVCTQHYHRWLHAVTADIAKQGYFRCSACEGKAVDRKFRSPEEAVVIHRL
jgi:hypothetical protein